MVTGVHIPTEYFTYAEWAQGYCRAGAKTSLLQILSFVRKKGFFREPFSTTKCVPGIVLGVQGIPDKFPLLKLLHQELEAYFILTHTYVTTSKVRGDGFFWSKSLKYSYYFLPNGSC